MLRPRLALLLLLGLSLSACKVKMPWEPAVEVQVYPAGWVTGVQARRPLGGGATAFVRAAYNSTDRRDWGEHDDEQGEGFGLGVGIRRDRIAAAASTWFLGARLDLWWLEIDWREDDGESGTSDIVVLQPVGEIGYRVRRAAGGVIEYALGLGSELNIETDGEDVGEGLILRFGVTYTF